MPKEERRRRPRSINQKRNRETLPGIIATDSEQRAAGSRQPASTSKRVRFDNEKPKYVDIEDEPVGVAVGKTTKFQKHWRKFAERVKVHEMLKCLESEYEKLEILRDRTWDEIEREKEVEEEEMKKDATAKEDQNDKEREAKRLLLLKSLQEERDYLTAIYPSIKHAFGDPKSVAQAAGRIFKTQANLTEEQVENIMNLCEDKIEQRTLREGLQERKAREKYLQNASEMRRMMYDFLASKNFTRFMLFTIITSVIGIFLLTFEMIQIRYGFLLNVLDDCFIGIFLAEAILKISIYKDDYFKKVWNILDMLTIATHFADVFVELITKTMALSTDINSAIWFKMFKALRALRLLRIIKFLPNLQVILTTVFQSFLSLGSIALLMLLFMYVFAVMGKGLFSEDAPDNFGTLALAFITLFQLLTLDDWFNILRDMDVHEKYAEYWVMFLFLFSYLVLEYFVFLNLFVAVLVDNFQITLAEAELKRQKESLAFGEDDKIYGFDEDDRSETSLEDQQEQRFEQTATDYFPVVDGSRECHLLENLLKDMSSIDFERYIWNRRVSILNNLMDRALLDAKPYSLRYDDNRGTTTLIGERK